MSGTGVVSTPAATVRLTVLPAGRTVPTGWSWARIVPTGWSDGTPVVTRTMPFWSATRWASVTSWPTKFGTTTAAGDSDGRAPPPPDAIWKTRKAISASRMTAPIPAIQTTGLVSSSGA